MIKLGDLFPKIIVTNDSHAEAPAPTPIKGATIVYGDVVDTTAVADLEKEKETQRQALKEMSEEAHRLGITDDEPMESP